MWQLQPDDIMTIFDCQACVLCAIDVKRYGHHLTDEGKCHLWYALENSSRTLIREEGVDARGTAVAK